MIWPLSFFTLFFILIFTLPNVVSENSLLIINPNVEIVRNKTTPIIYPMLNEVNKHTFLHWLPINPKIPSIPKPAPHIYKLNTKVSLIY